MVLDALRRSEANVVPEKEPVSEAEGLAMEMVGVFG